MTTQDIGQSEAPQEAEQQQQQAALASMGKAIWNDIQDGFRNNTNLFNRMDDDYDLYRLEQWQPDEEEPIAIEDAYTTNSPKVLADKIIAFISQTEMVIRVDSDLAGNQQEEINDKTEELAIGMFEQADRRYVSQGRASNIQDSLAWYATIRGRWAAARALLRKRPNGDTIVDILPLDPRYLVIQEGDDELQWAAYRTLQTRKSIAEKYPNVSFAQDKLMDDTAEEVWEIYRREINPNFDIQSQNPFLRHPFIYTVATLVEEQFAAHPTPVFTLNFPVVLRAVTSQPTIAPQDLSKINSINGLTMDRGTSEDFGESVFAANRDIWDKKNRVMSYKLDLLAKAANPPIMVASSDGTTEIEEGATDKGATFPIAANNNEDVTFMNMPDINRATLDFDARMNVDEVGGGLPPQAVGLLDKPLSSVALRQLGLNLEQAVVPRMNGVQSCIEGCFEVLIAQYETGAWEPLTVSGRRFDRQRFANNTIQPQEIQGHNPVEVSMKLALPQDDNLVWTRAQMAATPTASGEPLMDLEWIRENILGVQFPNLATQRNREVLAQQSSPVVQMLKLYEAAVKDGDMETAAALFDQIRIATLESQLQGTLKLFQLQQLSEGIPPATALNEQSVGQAIQKANQSGEFLNPANGAAPAVEFSGIGNQASTEAGANTTADRQRDTGLVSENGTPLTSR